jgi:hypothetical protein
VERIFHIVGIVSLWNIPRGAIGGQNRDHAGAIPRGTREGMWSQTTLFSPSRLPLI